MSALGAGIGTGLNALSGLLGYGLASGDYDQADDYDKQAAQLYGNVSAPQIAALVAQEAGQSAAAGAPSDYGNQGARNAAIQQFVNYGRQGGSSLDDLRTQAQAQRAAGAASHQTQQSVLQSAASRGVGGSAATLQAQLLGASQGADRAAQVGQEGAYNARAAALQALAQGGGMAQQAESADSARDMARRQSLDAMAQFNAQMRQQTQQQNAQWQQQAFQNQQQVADRQAQSKEMDADRYRRRAGRTIQVAGSIGQAAGAAGGFF